MNNVIPLRTFLPRPEDEIELIHSPFYPADLYAGEKASAVISTSLGGTWQLRIWRISPMGVELVLENDDKNIDLLQKGIKVDLRITINKHISDLSGLVIASRHMEGETTLLGIRWCYALDDAPRRDNNSDRRKSERWLCGSDFLPTGVAPNPIRFNDFIHFRVRDLSLTGLQLLTSLRNKHLIPGMKLDSILSLPMTGEVKFLLVIANTRIFTIDGKDYLSLGTVIENADERATNVLGQYIFQFGPATTIEDLRTKGFSLSKASHAFEFGYVRTSNEYEEVLELRNLTYKAANKIPTDATKETNADIFDARARILTVRYRNLLVATARLMFHLPEDQFEHEQFLKFPDSFPRKDQTVELTRICTHPDFRGSDLFYAIIKHISLTVAQSNRPWILGSAEPKLVPLYRKLGYTQTGVFFNHRDLGGITHEILLGHLPQMLSGKNVSMALWNGIYSDLTNFIKEQDIVEFDPFMNLRINLFHALKPFTSLFSPVLGKPKKITPNM